MQQRTAQLSLGHPMSQRQKTEHIILLVYPRQLCEVSVWNIQQLVVPLVPMSHHHYQRDLPPIPQFSAVYKIKMTVIMKCMFLAFYTSHIHYLHSKWATHLQGLDTSHLPRDVGDFCNGAIDFGWDIFDEETKLYKCAIELNNGRAATGILPFGTLEL